ncbi:MAG: hypothetical protein H6642_01340 [Caldilineaceae bacterium]|nr:hypothetical protein [Caldilineaceae bacterium]
MRQREDVLAYGNNLFPKLTIIFLMLALTLTQFSLAYAQTVAVSGNVFEDANGLTDGSVNGTGISKAGNVQLYATLLDSSGFVVESVPVGAGGAYSFSTVAAGDYSIQLSITDETFKTGMLPSTVPLVPPDWQFTGENLGAGPGDDGTVDGRLAVTVGATAITDANFGIKQQDTDGDNIPDSVDPDYDGNGINDVSEGICYNIEFGGDHTNPTTPAIQNTWIMHSGKSAYKDDNNNKIRRIVDNPDLSVSPDLDVSNLVPNNLTLTYLPGPESYQVTDVSSATLAEAKANGEYIEVIFKTDSSFSMAAIDWVGFLNRPDNQPGFSVTYSISSDGGNTFNDLVTFVEAADQNIGSFPDGRRNADIDPKVYRFVTRY